ncbi:MAG: C-terminal binding protein [Clostridia bacterium]|nr:C-terminal binding protein [Clostridia bacterium]
MDIIMFDRQGNDYSLEKETFEKAGATFTVTYFKDTEDFKNLVRGKDVVMFNDAAITKEIIDSMDKCKMLIRYGIGYDSVDLKAAGEAGIYVCNSPCYGVYDVAEYAMALMLSCCKHIPLADKCTREGAWSPLATGKVRRLTKKTLGLVGFGRIARKVAERSAAFEMDILVYDPYVTEEDAKAAGVKKVELSELIASSDFISLHSPLNDDTFHMFSDDEFKLMKKDAVLVNTGRGGLVDEKALIKALKEGEIGGAALDVLEEEPVAEDNPLLTMSNVVLSPHVAWNSFEGVDDLHKEVTDNVMRFINGETPVSIVNKEYLK